MVWFTYWTPSPTQEIPRGERDRPYLVEQHVGGMLTRSGKRTPRYDHVREANRFLHAAGGALIGWDNAHVAHWRNGRGEDDGKSLCLTLRGEQFSAVVGTFARGDQRRVVIANDSYSKPATFSLRAQSGRRCGRILAALEAEKAVGCDGISAWKLAPGGCLLVECPREDEVDPILWTTGRGLAATGTETTESRLVMPPLQMVTDASGQASWLSSGR